MNAEAEGVWVAVARSTLNTLVRKRSRATRRLSDDSNFVTNYYTLFRRGRENGLVGLDCKTLDQGSYLRRIEDFFRVSKSSRSTLNKLKI